MENKSHSRQPAVAGQFYPADRDQLASMLEEMLKQAKSTNLSGIKALIAPHAGFIYSGPIAAAVYQTLLQQSDQFKRVILLGPSHRVGFHGLATTSADSYDMPFGKVPVDRSAVSCIKVLPQVVELDQAHASEHSLEVQLPFLQMVLNDFTLVPLVVGNCPANQVAEVLDLLWGGDETLIVISSDLSHYNSYKAAQYQDQQTSEAILELMPQYIQTDDACGHNPVNGLLLAAKQHNLQTHLIDLRNSGDTAGPQDRVVGYGAYLFTE